MRTILVSIAIFTAALLTEASAQDKAYPIQPFSQQAFARSLNAFIGAADIGFANYRGDKMTGRGEKREAKPSMPGAYFCDVDWNQDGKEPNSKAQLICDHGEGLPRAQALHDFTLLNDAVKSQSWVPWAATSKSESVLDPMQIRMIVPRGTEVVVLRYSRGIAYIYSARKPPFPTE